jgi:hypothetical protein
MKTSISALALGAALFTAAPAAVAQDRDGPVVGVVGDVFGERFTLTTPEGRFLVTTPGGAAAPMPGARVRVEGARDGSTIEAASIAPADGRSADAAPSRDAAGDTVLPETLRDHGLSDVRSRSDRDDGETKWSARLPDGGWLRAETRWDGSLKDVKTDGAPIPHALAAGLLGSIAGHPELGRIQTITEIEFKPRGEIEIEGVAADGMAIELKFNRDGRLTKMERERADRRRWSPEEVRARLTDAGYGDIGWINLGGKHADAEATNPWGERVEVRLDDHGRVDRERAFDR